jgi:hypothetical protein
MEHFPNFRQATPENCESFFKNKKILGLVQVS